MATVCTFEGCEKRSHAKGLCGPHYSRVAYKADPETHRAKARANNRTVNGRYTIMANNAKTRQIPMTLTLEQYKALIADNCAYCGGALPEAGAGLDRLDSAKGYEIGNVKACCSTCNTMKSDLSEAEMYAHMERVLERRNSKGKQ